MTPHAHNANDDKLNVPLTIFGSIVLVALLVLLNFYPSLVGVWTVVDGEWQRLIVPTPEFMRDILPWINVSLGLALSLACIHVIYGRWMPATRWADLGLTVFSLLVMSQILHAGPLLMVAPAALDGGGASVVLLLPGEAFRGIVWLIFVCTAIGALVKFVQLLQQSVAAPAGSSA